MSNIIRKIAIGNYEICIEKADNLVEIPFWYKLIVFIGCVSLISIFLFGLSASMSYPKPDILVQCFNISVILTFICFMICVMATPFCKSGCGATVYYRKGVETLSLTTYIFTDDSEKDAIKLKEIVDGYKQDATVKWTEDILKMESKIAEEKKCECQFKNVMSKLEE